MGSQEEEEEEFCRAWLAKLTFLVAFRSMFLLADLLIAAEIWRTQCFIIALTFDFFTSPSTNCNFSLTYSRKRCLITLCVRNILSRRILQFSMAETIISKYKKSTSKLEPMTMMLEHSIDNTITN